MRLLPLIIAALLLGACGITSLPIPFVSTPTPPPPPPRPAVTPTPTPTPLPKVEVTTVKWGPNARAGEHGVSIAFLLRNPNADQWVLQGSANAKVFTPDGRPLPNVGGTVQFDLGPGEERWYAVPEVSTFSSIVGKVTVDATGGQWLAAPIYPYPGGVPVSVALDAPAKTPVPATPAPAGAPRATATGTPTPPPAATPAPTPARPVVPLIVTNNGDLGVQGVVRGFSFAGDELAGIVECGAALYPARAALRVTCLATRPEALGGTFTFAVYPDLRPVIVIPSSTPSAGQTAAPTATPRGGGLPAPP